MAAVNKVFLMGNLTREPEVRQLPSGSLVCDFGLAVNRRFTNNRGETQEETCFVDITIFGRTAEVVRNFCHKGDPLFVEGRLRYDQWDDKTTGQRRSRLTVVGDNIELLRGRNDGQQQAGQPMGGSYGYPQASRPAYNSAPSYQPNQGYQNNGMGAGQQQYAAAPRPMPPVVNSAVPQDAVPPMPRFQNSPSEAAAPVGEAPVDDVPF